jgi:hypothetical protein
MITWGFVPSYSDVVTVGSLFAYNGLNMVASYIFVGGAGDIVWENNNGDPQWFPGAQANQGYIMGARRILASATVNGVSRTTTATSMVWMSSNTLFNSP